MKEEKKKMLEEVLATGEWTRFLENLPIKRPDTFHFKNVGQILTLKAVAGRLNSRPSHMRSYSIKNVDYVNFSAIIEAKKKNGNA